MSIHHKLREILFIFKGLLLLAAFISPVGAAARYSAWAAYWESEKTEAAYTSYGRALDRVRIFACHFNEQGDLIPASPWIYTAHSTWSAKPKRKDQRFYLTIVNDVVVPSGNKLKDPEIVRRVIADPAARQKHIAQILQCAQGVHGVEIDYERVYRQDREAFTAFIQELAQALKETKQSLSVVVEPKTEEADFDGPGAADWAALGAVADEVIIMAYYRHYASGPPGPLAPVDWVLQVAQYAQAHVPVSKVTMALSLEAIDWSSEGGREISWETANEKRKLHAAALERPGSDASPRFFYEVAGVRHEVWLEDLKSLREKLRALEKVGIRSFSFWRLGSGDPAFWKRYSGTLK